MPLISSLVAPCHITRSHPNSPNDYPLNTPNTRKRQQLDYARLHNGPPRGASPTLISLIQNTAPVAQMCPRYRPRTRPPYTRQNKPLFLPEHDPLLGLSSTVITIDSNTPSSLLPK